MKKYINTPFITLLIIYLVLASFTYEFCLKMENPLIVILSSAQSPLNLSRNYFYIYPLMLTLMVEPYMSQNPTLKIIRYQSTDSYYIKEIFKPNLIVICLQICLLYVIILLLAIFSNSFNWQLMMELIKNFIFYAMFYFTVTNIYNLFGVLGINKYVSILINLLLFIYLYNGNTIISNSLILLVTTIGSKITPLIILSFLLWLSFNIGLLILNMYLFNKKDLR